MRIGILTQPLHANYGGILQNYALQQVLKNIGAEVWTIDYDRHNWLDWADNVWRVFIFKMLGRTAHFVDTPNERKRKEMPLRRFVNKHIHITKPRTKIFERRIVKKYAFDTLVVGSDQVWRPMYNYNVEDCFLKFALNLKIKKVAYAASFGTDEWEFTPQQTEECAMLAKLFDGISVREKSGVILCGKYLGVSATNVLDPTLLLHAEDYKNLCKDIPKREPFIFAYILDENEAMINNIKDFAESRGLPFLIKGADNSVGDNDTIELWLSYFRDAEFIITDSFHGTAFSIIFNKDFYVYGNKKRGNSRFHSLLGIFDLKNRMIGNTLPDVLCSIDWNIVNEKREVAIKESKSWLNQILKISQK